MSSHANEYLERLSQIAQANVASELDPQHAVNRADAAIAYHFNDAGSRAFQDYYLEILENREAFLATPDFFTTFKKRYSLQAIDGEYLANLEGKKEALLELLDADDLNGLYFGYFANADLRHKGKLVRRNLGSFFAKFVHTFRPTEYCALDNPIKDLLGLEKEGFFLAFLAISSAYRSWVVASPSTLAAIRTATSKDKEIGRYVSKMSDLKVIDLIFWQRANKPRS